MKTFREAGGSTIVRQYLYSGVFVFATVQILLNGFSKKSLEIVRLAVYNKVIRRLFKKYRGLIAEHKASAKPTERIRSNKVWVCWLQGIESAPELVQRCFASLQKHLTDREIILLTEDNYRQYVTFPEHIQKKIDSGIITRTHMSDLLRLELLLNHGGTWIDATVFCSGGNIPAYMMDADLFYFQTLKPGLDGHPTALSSWFMTSCTNHPILDLTRQMLYRYWEKHTAMVDYFLLHDLFQLAMEAYPDEWAKVVPCSNSAPHILLLRLFDTYDDSIWKATQEMTPFHKLSYKFPAENITKKHTYYSQVLTGE